MKKLILIFLTLVLGATAQDVYRLNDSTFVYPCIASDSTTSLNFVGLPLETGWTMASDLDPSGTNIDAVSWFDETQQTWFTAGHHPALGWSCDFPVETGGAYLFSAKNDFDFTVTGDSIRVVYDIKVGGNTITIPLEKTELNYATDLAYDNGISLSTVSRYLPDQQEWNSTSGFGWANNFEIEIGQPLWVSSNISSVWPDDVKEGIKKDYSRNEASKINKPAKKLAKSSGNLQPLKVYIHLQDIYGNELNVPEDTDKVEIWFWISGREGEVISSKDWYLDTGNINLNGFSTTYMNLIGFPTPTLPGEILIIYPVRYNPDGTTWPIVGTIYSHVLEASSSPVYLGYEPLIPGSGESLKLDMEQIFPISTEVNVEETMITVSWVDWRAASYNLYWSNEPYGEFEFVTNTTETSWQFSTVGSKKFYRVTGVYNDKKDE